MAGNGIVVDVSEDHIDEMAAGFQGGRDIMGEKFNQTFTLTNDLTELVKGYLSDFEEALYSYQLPAGFSDAIGDVVISPINPIDISTAPSMGTLNLPEFGDIPFPLMPALKAAPVVDLSFTKPTKPTEINPALNYTITPYNSDMWLNLFSAVNDGVVSGGTGVDSTVEAAIYARGQEKDRVANDTLFRATIKEKANKGIKYPMAARINAENEMALEVYRQDRNRSNELVVSQAQLAQTNTHFILDKAVALEQILRAFWGTYEGMDLDAKKAAADLVIRNYEQKWNAYIADISGELDIKKMMLEGVNVVIAENNLLGQVFKIESDGAIAKVDRISKERDSLVEAYKADGQVYEAKTRAQTAWYNALTEQQKAELEKSRIELDKAVKAADMELKASISVNSLRERILDAMSNIAAQVLASALNAVNTSIGHSTSASEQRNEAWSHGDNINETHSIEHDIA